MTATAATAAVAIRAAAQCTRAWLVPGGNMRFPLRTAARVTRRLLLFLLIVSTAALSTLVTLLLITTILPATLTILLTISFFPVAILLPFAFLAALLLLLSADALHLITVAAAHLLGALQLRQASSHSACICAAALRGRQHRQQLSIGRFAVPTCARGHGRDGVAAFTHATTLAGRTGSSTPATATSSCTSVQRAPF